MVNIRKLDYCNRSFGLVFSVKRKMTLTLGHWAADLIIFPRISGVRLGIRRAKFYLTCGTQAKASHKYKV